MAPVQAIPYWEIQYSGLPLVAGMNKNNERALRSLRSCVAGRRERNMPLVNRVGTVMLILDQNLNLL